MTSYRSRVNSDSWDNNTFKKLDDKKSNRSNENISKTHNNEVNVK